MSMHSRIFARRVHHTYPHRTQWTYSCTSYMRTIQHCDRALGTNNTDDDNGNGQATTATDDDNGNGHAQAGQHARFMRRWSRGFFFFFPGFSRLSILRCLLHLALVLSKTMKISSSEDEAACQTHEECSQMREERAVQVLCDARAGMLRGACEEGRMLGAGRCEWYAGGAGGVEMQGDAERTVQDHPSELRERGRDRGRRTDAGRRDRDWLGEWEPCWSGKSPQN